jgi:hypothetical protein
MAKVFTHHGHCENIPTDASPGLRFIKAFLPALDSLEPSLNPIGPFLASKAHFVINGGSPTPAHLVIGMLDSRGKKLSFFHHDMKVAWDMEKDGGKRTVMYESVSVTVFRNDTEKVEVKVPEFNIIELEPLQNGSNVLVAVELRSYLETKPIMQRVSELGEI